MSQDDTLTPSSILHRSTLSHVATTKAKTTTTTTAKKKKIISSLCLICDAPARYSYYGAIVCHSCKVFFRRHAQRDAKSFRCDLEGHCRINVSTRRSCSSCRLAKCLSIGMSPDMIRSSLSRKIKNRRRKKSHDDSPSTPSVRSPKRNQSNQIDSLSLERSVSRDLTVDQWTLVDKVVHCFDDCDGLMLAQRFVHDQDCLPIKIRLKDRPVIEFFTRLMIQSQLTFERNRDFLALSLPDRSLLLRHTVKYTSTLGTIFTIREGHLFESSSFSKAMDIVFRRATATWATRAVEQLNVVDSIWLKLVVSIVAFSTFTCPTSNSRVLIGETTARRLSCVQDKYIELAWRYLLHKHTDQQAVLCFSSLIRCLFLVNETIREAEETQLFPEIIDCVVQATEQLWQANR